MYAYQDLLVGHLKSVFPNEYPLINARKQVNLKYSPTDSQYLELDVWFPNHSICFEFQDAYHYTTTWYHQTPTSQVQLKDSRKKELVQQAGLELIIIPCWWDCMLKSLQATLHFQCPELLESESKSTCPIPLNPPVGHFQSTEISDVGELMYASFASDPTLTLQSHWWLGEKYDGVRCCWIPQNRKVYSRFNNEITVSPSFLSNIPFIAIDGELWYGRGSYSQVFKLIKKSLLNWDLLRITAFDFPLRDVHHKPFETRYEHLLDAIPANNPCTIIAMRFLWIHDTDIKRIAQSIIEHAGEGVIMRRICSRYEHGRSLSLLKYKGELGDAEGVVVSIKSDCVGLKLPDGRAITVPSEKVHIKNLAVGDVVTFSYEADNQQTSRLVNPTIKRIRHDIVWQDAANIRTSNTSPTPDDSTHLSNSKKPTSVWYDPKKRRRFFETYAKANGFDPLNPAKWYTQQRKKILATKGAHGVLSYHSFSVFKALSELFSELKFNKLKFQWPALWKEAKNRRKFFETYAREKNFDPLNPVGWYSQTKRLLLSLKNVRQIIRYHNNNIRKTLFSLFPEIEWETSKLWPAEVTWSKPQTIKSFFEQYASSHNFGPLQAEHWYSHAQNLVLLPEVQRISSKFGGSIAATLNNVFPSLEVQKSRMNIYLPQAPLRRRLFVGYAKRNRFDPLNPDNWYSQSKEKILAVHRLRKVITAYNGSISATLIALFPEIGLAKSKFLQMLWRDRSVRRRFMENYAQRNGFDPLTPYHWYSTLDDLSATKGASQVMHHHNGSIAQALSDIFPDIGLDLAKLVELERVNRRKLFESYARENEFDPLNPANWYFQPRKKIHMIMGVQKALQPHDGSISKALVHLFPDIGFDESKYCG